MGSRERDVVFRIIDLVIKNGFLTLVECLHLKVINTAFRMRYSNAEEIMRFVVTAHCIHTRDCWNESNGPFGSKVVYVMSPLQFRFWKANLVTQVTQFI